jgi:hypothetical protein
MMMISYYREKEKRSSTPTNRTNTIDRYFKPLEATTPQMISQDVQPRITNDGHLQTAPSPERAKPDGSLKFRGQDRRSHKLQNNGRIQRKYTVNSLGRVECPYEGCPWTFRSSTFVSNHMRKAHETKTPEAALRKNLFSKNSTGKQCCPHCSYSGTASNLVQRHVRRKHSRAGMDDLELMLKQDKQSRYCCPHCGHSDAVAANILHHVRFCTAIHPVSNNNDALVREWVCSVPRCIYTITQQVFDQNQMLAHAKQHETYGHGKAVDCYQKVPPYAVKDAIGNFWFSVFEHVSNGTCDSDTMSSLICDTKEDLPSTHNGSYRLASDASKASIWDHIESGAASFHSLDTKFVRNWNLETLRLRGNFLHFCS